MTANSPMRSHNSGGRSSRRKCWDAVNPHEAEEKVGILTCARACSRAINARRRVIGGILGDPISAGSIDGVRLCNSEQAWERGDEAK